MTLPSIPKDRNWSPETWRSGWDDACKRSGCYGNDDVLTDPETDMVVAHATRLLDTGIVKPVVGEAEVVWKDAKKAEWAFATPCDGGGLQLLAEYNEVADEAAIAVIQSALDKARAGQ